MNIKNQDIETGFSSEEENKVWRLLEEVYDPEIPVLSVIDLGVIRDIRKIQSESREETGIDIVITPTYSGCPAMDMIAMNIRLALLQYGFNKINVTTVLSPAWTTDWMSEAGKEKLKAYGIAPPNPKQQVCHNDLFAPHEAVQCPHCNSWHTHRISEFGSTACKALYHCDKCEETFDYFKCH